VSEVRFKLSISDQVLPFKMLASRKSMASEKKPVQMSQKIGTVQMTRIEDLEKDKALLQDTLKDSPLLQSAHKLGFRTPLIPHDPCPCPSGAVPVADDPGSRGGGAEEGPRATSGSAPGAAELGGEDPRGSTDSAGPLLPPH